MRHGLGTLAWLERTHGQLGLRGRLAMLAQGVRARAATRERLKQGIKVRHIEVDSILPPDSAIAREAMAMMIEASPPFLINHCLRAYFWARLLDDGARSHDDEALFVALMLHDMGLTDGHRLAGTEERCFTLVGARLAENLGAQHGWGGQRCRIAAEAIALHLNVVVDPRHGREAELVRAGSGGDVAGLGLDVLHGDQIDAVCGRYPRLGFKQQVVSPLRLEAEHRPGCRMAFMMDKLGFERLIANAPMFAE